MQINTVSFLTHLPGKFAVMVNNAKPQETTKASHQVHGDKEPREKGQMVEYELRVRPHHKLDKWHAGYRRRSVTSGQREITVPPVFGTVGASLRIKF